MATKPNGFDATGIDGDERIIPVPDESTPIAADNNDGNVIPIIEPTSIEGAASTERRGRGRPRKSGSGTTVSGPRKEKQATSNLTNILMGIHMMCAAITKTPELELDEEEARKLGAAVNQVNSLYGNMMLTEKQEAWLNLATVAGTVYAPRIVARGLRIQQEKKEKAKAATVGR